MARKQIPESSLLSFDSVGGVIVISGHVSLSKLLLINDATINTLLYNFSDPNLKATCTYNSLENKTTINLINYSSSNFPGISNTDVIQVYYEKEEIEIKPTRTYRDPVSKLRTSSPETLIDTDFEYGLQPTKWETLKLVNNIPTSYSTTSPEEGLSATSVKSTLNSYEVSVTTSSPHNLVSGAIIEIVGLSDSAFEGTFIVKVSDSLNFTYKVPFKSSRSVLLKTDYTLIYPGAFYTGSSVDVDDVSTNAVTDASTITVSTSNYHGFDVNTKLYLKKTRATNSFSFTSPADVIAAATTAYNSIVASPPANVETEYYSKQDIITDDYIGDFEINLGNSSLNTGNGVISYSLNNQIGDSRVTSVQTGDVLIFYTPTGNVLPSIGSTQIQRFTPFFVTRATTNTATGIVTFTVSQIYKGTEAAFNVATSSTTFGNHRFIKGFKIEAVTATDSVTSPQVVNFVNGDNVVAISTYNGVGTPPGGTSNGFRFTKTLGSQLINVGTNFQFYNVSNVVRGSATSTFTLNNNPNTSPSATITFGGSTTFDFVVLAKLKSHPLANSLYLPQVSGFSSNPFPNGFYGTYSCTAPNAPIGGLTSGNKYYFKGITGKPNWYNLYLPTDTTLRTPLDFYFNTDAFASLVYAGPHSFSGSVDRSDQHTISISTPPRGGLLENDLVVYSSSVSAIGNLVSNQSYRIKTLDNRIGFSQLRLSNSSSTGITSVHSMFHTAGSNTAVINVFTSPTSNPYPSLADCGIVPGGFIQLSGFDASSQADGITINDIFQGLHPVVSTGVTGAAGVNLSAITVSLPSWKNITNAITIPNTSQNILASTAVCGIITFTNVGGTGTHIFTRNVDGAVDDLYFIKSIPTEKSFTFDTTTTIPQVSKNVNSVVTGTTDTSSLKITSHNFADGIRVTYSTTGTAIGGLTNGSSYYVRVLDNNFIALSATIEGATNRETTSGLIAFTSIGTGTHTFVTSSVKGFLTGSGTVGFTSSSNIINGTNTKFFTDFSNGDLFRIYALNPSTTGPGTYFESKITSVKSDNILKLEGVPIFSSSSSNYFVPTRLYAISDGKTVHRPYDGGVTMTTGLIPNTQIIRQTRKYFRYQSGKGIQISQAVNFNPTFDIDLITRVGSGTTTYYKITSKYAHQISERSANSNQKIRISNVVGTSATVFNRTDISGFNVVSVDDDFNFTIDVGNQVVGTIGGFPQFNVVNWQDSAIKCGMFDDQNGFFFKYDGVNIYAVRRSSTKQLSGVFSVERNSHTLKGTRSVLPLQVSSGDRIVVRGQTYKVTKVIDDSTLDIQPAYRGNTTSNIIVSKVSDTEVPQSQWNIDTMDGTGESGYNLDVNKIQMVYMDYSWYGAGSIRFGFKDQYGEVKYAHEFVHNNDFTESYFRSGNIPARYEVETFRNPLFAPSLFHWGVSVIMDGRFDDDKAYLFTAESSRLPFTNGGLANSGGGGGRPTGDLTAGSKIITSINRDEASVLTVGETIETTTGTIPLGTLITGIEIDQSSEVSRFSSNYSLTISNPATATAANATLNVYSGTSAQLRSYIPLVSIRLSPAVDNATISNLGYRDIINRMQLTLKSAGVLTTHDCEVRIILNPKLSDDNFVSVGSPSLSQIYRHSVGDSYSGGVNVFAFRAQGGSVSNSNSLRRNFNVTDVSLAELALLGNSILGGDGVFPDGPDILTIAVRPVDTSQITGSAPFIVTGRITWTEAQA